MARIAVVPSSVLSALALVLMLWSLSAVSAPEPFFAPAVTTGSVDVRLYPTEGIAAGTMRRITFGVPFPRGSIVPADISKIRVLRTGLEISAHVEMLTPWRHRTNAAIDGQSVRIALIQINLALNVNFPNFDTVTVEWGGVNRALDVPALLDPRGAWHQVTAGSFNAADNVFEPDVYAVMPGDWLARGGLSSTRSRPFDPSNLPTRDNPATNDAILHWPEYREAEHALKNNFYSEVNRDDPLVPPAQYPQYKTEREPWLYDRAATMFVLYERSGNFLALREGVQAAQFYAGRTDANGSFSLAPGDTKYTYNQSLAYVYWLTGDPQMPAKIAAASTGQNGFTHTWTATRGFWTERHAGFKLLAKVVAYEVLGTPARGAEVTQILADFRAHQNGIAPIPATRIDGGLYHYGFQHDGDWADNSLGASSWMSVLLSDAVVRAYGTGEDAPTAQFIARMGVFLRATVINSTDHDYDTSAALASPRYGMLVDGSDGQVNGSDTEHALEVAAHLAWADYFARLGGTPNPALRVTALALYATYDEGVNFWIRPDAPGAGASANTAYRVNPHRKWGWEHRTSSGIGFALTDIDPNPPLFANGFE